MKMEQIWRIKLRGDKDAKQGSGWERMKGSAIKGEEKEERVQARKNGNAVQLYNTPTL